MDYNMDSRVVAGYMFGWLVRIIARSSVKGTVISIQVFLINCFIMTIKR